MCCEQAEKESSIHIKASGTPPVDLTLAPSDAVALEKLTRAGKPSTPSTEQITVKVTKSKDSKLGLKSSRGNIVEKCFDGLILNNNVASPADAVHKGGKLVEVDGQSDAGKNEHRPPSPAKAKTF